MAHAPGVAGICAMNMRMHQLLRCRVRWAHYHGLKMLALADFLQYSRMRRAAHASIAPARSRHAADGVVHAMKGLDGSPAASAGRFRGAFP